MIPADPLPLKQLTRASRVVPREFYARPTAEVARALLGKVIVHGRTAGRIVETEAYLGLDDLAAHASRGVTGRTRVLFGPPGYAYVYFIYGMYECLNFVADHEGRAGCVLIRALEPLAGLGVMQRRRPRAARVEDLASGPGKLTQALAITRVLYGADLARGPLTVRALCNEPPFETAVTPRINVHHCADWPLRFIVAGSRFVSR
ncbi:MAG TPA: DNA-3-methyladenine glycosylase [Bryobacteraceae bacterium]|nr:DNA-3-methyladenine glycosylase [Bryobacteraceae bacterium]